MQIKVNRAAFAKALSRTQNIVDKKSTMPILANVLLAAHPKGLTITATDLGVGVVIECDAEIVTGGAITLPGKSFLDVVKNLPGEVVSLTVAENYRCIVKAEKAEFKIIGLSDSEYPKMPNPEDAAFVAIDAAVFRDMINKTMYAVSTDETRFHLNGVYFVGKEGTLRLVSTDGHRLSICSNKVAGADLFGNLGAIVPKKGLLELQKLLESEESIEIALRGSNLYVRAPGLSLSIKLVDAQFPDYEQVLPKSSALKAEINRQLLISALKRISLLSSDKSYGVKCAFTTNLMQISSSHQDFGEGREELDIVYAGKPLEIGFNAKYMLESLNATNAEQIMLSMNDEISPGKITPIGGDDYTCVIMPMRL